MSPLAPVCSMKNAQNFTSKLMFGPISTLTFLVLIRMFSCYCKVEKIEIRTLEQYRTSLGGLGGAPSTPYFTIPKHIVHTVHNVVSSAMNGTCDSYLISVDAHIANCVPYARISYPSRSSTLAPLAVSQGALAFPITNTLGVRVPKNTRNEMSVSLEKKIVETLCLPVVVAHNRLLHHRPSQRPTRLPARW
jgi:hypothetical protein